MRLGRTLALLLFGAATVGGCAYFNGLYNANQLVKDALRAEREGRIGEARSLWSRAAVKAESVAVRYPESRYYDDALVLQGRALRAAGQCRSAVGPLRVAIDSSRDRRLVEQANFFLGRCQYADGDIDSAIAAFSRSLPSDDTLLSSAAHLWRGRAYANLGEYESAIVDFSASSLIDVAFDLSVAFARIGRRTEAEGVLRWRVDGEYSEALWLAALDSIGEHFPDLSSNVADLLLERADLDEVERGELLLQDGDRWAEIGEMDHASTRFIQVLELDTENVAGSRARFRLILSDIRSTSDLRRLNAWSDTLTHLAELDIADEPIVGDVSAAIEMAAASLETATDAETEDAWQLQNPDLEMFLAAEALRDRVGATSMAVALFRELPKRFPGSPVAPKALLAAADLDPVSSDSLLAVVRRSYPRSPYTLVLRGMALDAYAAIEDSLRTLILSRRGAS